MGAVTGNDDHCLHGDSICLNEFSAWNYCKMTRASASIKDNIAEELVNIHSTILRTRGLEMNVLLLILFVSVG